MPDATTFVAHRVLTGIAVFWTLVWDFHLLESGREVRPAAPGGGRAPQSFRCGEPGIVATRQFWVHGVDTSSWCWLFRSSQLSGARDPQLVARAVSYLARALLPNRRSAYLTGEATPAVQPTLTPESRHRFHSMTRLIVFSLVLALAGCATRTAPASLSQKQAQVYAEQLARRDYPNYFPGGPTARSNPPTLVEDRWVWIYPVRRTPGDEHIVMVSFKPDGSAPFVAYQNQGSGIYVP